MNNTFLRYALAISLCFIFSLKGFSQAPISVRTCEKLPFASPYLLLPDSQLKAEVARTEAVLDMVQAWMSDSLVEAKRQRHLGFGGWLAQRLGSRYWEVLDRKKHKYIGTCSRPFKVYKGFADEYDMNIFLLPHLPEYISTAKSAFEAGRKRPRGDNAFRFDKPDYACPKDLEFEDRGYITIECEGTPAEAYRAELAEVFLPMAVGPHSLGKHPNFGTKYPSFGMYGTWCLDCNHNCRPEVHPIEWLWWLDMSADRPGSVNAKSWMIGAFRDGSGRMEDWSPGPLAGVISIPIALPAQAKTCEVILEHLIFDHFQPEKMLALGLPESALPAETGVQKYSLIRPQGKPVAVRVNITGKNPGDGMRIWWSDFRQEKSSGTLIGQLNIATAVENIYAGRLTVDYL